jgi:alanyl-tRNA synthetase
LKRTGELVNDAIFIPHLVKTSHMSRSAAADLGAVALFGEKYGEEVRVVDVEGFSRELCGGTHVDDTGKIGLFLITSETGIASGVRRIEALTGRAAFNCLFERFEITNSLSRLLRTPADKLSIKISDSLERQKSLEKALREKEKSEYIKFADSKLKDARQIGGVRVLAVKLDNAEIDDLRAVCESLTAKNRDLILLVSSIAGGKPLFVCGVSKEIVDRYKAGDIVKQASQVVGGSGGGRQEMAQAGGGQIERVDLAIEKFYSLF